MTRFLVVTMFLLLALAVVVWAYELGVNTETGTLLVNLGTEIFGILITLAVVDWLLERRRLQDRARELAWSILHGIERGVWLWQGGPRRLDTDELLGLIAGIRPDHPIRPVTRTLLVSLGVECREALKREQAAVKNLPGLREALEDLTSLQTLGDDDSSVSVRMVSEVLESATGKLARILGQATRPMPAGLVRYRDPSPEAQEERFHDMRPAAGAVADRRGRGGAGEGPGLDPEGSPA